MVDVEKAYALACFNVLAHNRDDHARNFSFLLGEGQALGHGASLRSYFQ